MGYALLREKPPLGQKVEDLGLHLENVLLSDCCVRGKSAANDKCASGQVLPGQYFDQETNLHYNHFRYYDPELGRYITSDPIGLLAGLNTYSYVNQNSVRFYDPTGEIGQVVVPVLIFTYLVNWWYWNVEEPEPLEPPVPPPPLPNEPQQCDGNWKTPGSDPWGNPFPWPDPGFGRAIPPPEQRISPRSPPIIWRR